MKKILLGVLLGFFLHKGIQTYYNYSWWTSELNCREDKREDYRICLYEDMGVKKYLVYLIIAPTYSFQKWEWGA